ncbi:hypothetical protein ACEQPO_29320 [Bacillus sp. SL00103]
MNILIKTRLKTSVVFQAGMIKGLVCKRSRREADEEMRTQVMVMMRR